MKENKVMQNTEDISLKIKNPQKFNFEKKYFSCKNIFYIFLTQYAWLSIIGLTIFLSFKYQYYHPAQLYYSKSPKEEWNSDYTPKIFMHLADIHISFYLGYRTNGSTIYLSDFLDYNPDLILNSGDVVDSYEESYWPKVGSQWPGDWGIYINTIKQQLSKFNIIDVAGNHDLFAVDSLFSKNNKC